MGDDDLPDFETELSCYRPEPCGHAYVEPVRDRTVTGTVMQPGFLFINGLNAWSEDPGSWTFDLKVTAGSHSMIVQTERRVVLLPAMDIVDDTTSLPPIDIARDGLVVLSAEIEVGNADRLDTMMDATLSLAPDQGVPWRLEDPVHDGIASTSYVDATGRTDVSQGVWVGAGSDDERRVAGMNFVDAPPSHLDLPISVAGTIDMQTDGTVVSPRFADFREVSRYLYTDKVEQTLHVWSGYIHGHGLTAIDLDRGAPGFVPSFDVAPAKTRAAAVQVTWPEVDGVVQYNDLDFTPSQAP